MALQLIHSAWYENEVEHSILRSSQGVTKEDIEFILRTVGITDDYDTVPDDENNESLSNTLYLHLPSSAYALIRTGQYTVPNSEQTGNVITHAFILESGEECSPLLYAINNCFKEELSQIEQNLLLTQDYLPDTPLPRPQFKLSQAEVRKFFSRGRLRMLAHLLQAVMDSYGNKRLILLNDSYPSLKYWLFGIHSCLPKNRTSYITYSTYAYHIPEGCMLICSAPGHSIDFDVFAEEGNFIIDNLDDIGSDNIEAAAYAQSIVKTFWEDMTRLPDILEGVEGLMDTYHLNVATAAGLYKLIEFDFEWFESAHEIHYYLGKIGTIDKTSLELISHKLWNAFSQPEFKFKLDSDNMSLLSYIFRNTSDEVRWEIVKFIEENKEALGYEEYDGFNSFYFDFCDKLSFLKDFLPIALIQSEQLEIYCENKNASPWELATFFRIIVERYPIFVEQLDFEVIKDNAIYLLESILHQNELELAFSICESASELPYDFLRYVIVQGVLNDANTPSESKTLKLHLPDEFTYRIARLLIKKDPSLALELVKNHARKGKYRDSTLGLYNALCRDFPDETADFDETLHQKTVYADFVIDSIFHKFASASYTTREELTDFFTTYFITGLDRNHYFESKLFQHLNDSLPVRGIETADYFLKLLASSTKAFSKYTLAGMLSSYVLNQSPMDLFDYYQNNIEAFKDTVLLLKRISSSLSPSFIFAMTVITVSTSLEHATSRYLDNTDRTLQYLNTVSIQSTLSQVTVPDDFGQLFLDKLLRYSFFISTNHTALARLTDGFIYSLYSEASAKKWLQPVWQTRVEKTPELLFPIAARFLILSDKTQDLSMRRLAYAVLDNVSRPKRIEAYSIMLSYAENEAEKSFLKNVLLADYRRNFSFLHRVFSRTKRKLFK